MANFDGNVTVFEEDEEFDKLMSQVDEADVIHLIEEKEEEENSWKRKAEEEGITKTRGSGLGGRGTKTREIHLGVTILSSATKMLVQQETTKSYFPATIQTHGQQRNFFHILKWVGPSIQISDPRQQELGETSKEVEEKLKRIQDGKIEEKRQEALKRMEESQIRKQAEEEIAQIYHPEFQAQKVLRQLQNIQRTAWKAAQIV
ncbi:hypothetical protein DAPPUDRAFT_259275 [Daphnia pulex]|uniref:Uncharacterized protein n=1 Tax=Daphnia pulex TaxID=6669 RepID=E9HGZ8_DAPPU|nr:hypothetical protein DAPPUDRAFT_259275 [Daphnia pulex]|eukprot:EFX68994.1 hypothetical protein DAPPUDRAFT_259275 [Daphnia pulex]